ncbi:hypothetical protein ABI063_14640, partial [Enterococcus faecium]|uniref:hypothetical protein n=1 Tax=Enterococcus faecium TaxID=1352 RepID=UPI003F42A4BC
MSQRDEAAKRSCWSTPTLQQAQLHQRDENLFSDSHMPLRLRSHNRELGVLVRSYVGIFMPFIRMGFASFLSFVSD